MNTANPRPVIGGGTDSAIYRAAGERALLAERRAIGDIAPGQAAATSAYALEAKHIIHTLGPAWIDGSHRERDILRACYANSLALAAELGAGSIAFPLIATGVYGFPKNEALDIAMAEIGGFLLSHDMEVILVVFDRTAFASMAAEPSPGARPFQAEVNSLDEVVGSAGETFQQKLFQLIGASGMDDVTVYKKANIDRKVFSRIRCKEDYQPKKKTAVAFAIALELDLPAARDLLSRAGIAFSPSSRFDLIVTYFINNRIYNIYTINSALFKYGQPILDE